MTQTTTLSMIKTNKYLPAGMKRASPRAGAGRPQKRLRQTESPRVSKVIPPKSMSQESNPPELDAHSSPLKPPKPKPQQQSTPISRQQSRPPTPDFILDDWGDSANDLAPITTTATTVPLVDPREAAAAAAGKVIPLSPPSTPPPPPLHLFRSLYRDNFERAIRVIKLALRKQQPKLWTLKILPPPRPPKGGDDKSEKVQTAATTTTTTNDSAKIVRQYLEMATALVNSLRNSSVLFNQANASFVSPQTRSLYSRFLRLKVVAAFARRASHSRGRAGSLMVGVEVIEGSVVGDGDQEEEEEEEEIERRFNRMTIADYPLPPLRHRSRLHLKCCPNYSEDDESDPPPPSPSPSPSPPPQPPSPETEDHQQQNSSLPSLFLLELSHISPITTTTTTTTTTTAANTSHQQTYPANALFPVGARLLLVYGRSPLPASHFKPGVTLMRLYPHWTAVHSQAGVRACCTTYHTLILNGFNFALEGVTT